MYYVPLLAIPYNIPYAYGDPVIARCEDCEFDGRRGKVLDIDARGYVLVSFGTQLAYFRQSELDRCLQTQLH